MEQIKLAIAVISFISQLLRWMNQAENSTLGAKIEKLIQFKKALEEAEKGKGEELEKMFTVMRPKPKPKS